MAKVAGAKRQGAPFPSPTVSVARRCKRPAEAAAMEEWRDWASLHPDLTELIAARALAADVMDYMSLRAVCTRWRASAPSPRDPTLRDERFRPRGWVALCDGDGVRPADAGEVALLNTATGRCLRARLPELRGYHVVGFTDGLLILLNKGTTAVRVMHPFTRAAVDLPPIAAVFRRMARDRNSRRWMRAAVCLSQTSTDSIAVVAWFPTSPGVVVAEPSFPAWHVVHHDIQLAAAAAFRGKLYGVIKSQRQVTQVYPQCRSPSIAPVPHEFGHPWTYSSFLVESARRLLLILCHQCADTSNEGWAACGFAMFEVDTAGHGGLAPVSSLGDRALFLASDRCLSVSNKDLPSISSNSIYLTCESVDPVLLYSVSSGACERTSTYSVIHDFYKRVRPSVRPFTLADHLLTYCCHRHWSSGLMFHEYHHTPESWKRSSRKRDRQDREVQLPRLGGFRPLNRDGGYSPSELATFC
ncbi:hypothetical protein ACP4OV_024028 [Aristida adscensionis]